MDDLSTIVGKRLELLGVGPKDRCLVGWSGGQDSTALLLAMLAGSFRVESIAAAHLDHAVRDGSEHDRRKVECLSRELGIRFFGHRLDAGEVRALYRETGSLEASLRKLRYDFLLRAAASFGAKWVITGHTADDQAETVLFRVLRGMDPMSFSGIPEKRSGILRPLISLRRTMTLSYCLGMGIEPIVDPSNSDHGYARNRLRCRTIPALEARFHPGLSDLLARMASLGGRLDAFKEKALEECLCVVPGTQGGVLIRERFDTLPRQFRRHAVAGFLRKGIGQWPSRSLLLEALGRIDAGKRGPMSLPGGVVMVPDGNSFSILHGGHEGKNDIPDDPVPLPLPGVLRFRLSGITLSSEEFTLGNPIRFPRGNTTLVRREQLRTPLWVRRRLPGDRFAPIGMTGRKKLKDLLIDLKIPRAVRDHIPLVVDNDGEILWVGGIGVSRSAALMGYEGEKAILIRMERDEDRTGG